MLHSVPCAGVQTVIRAVCAQRIEMPGQGMASGGDVLVRNEAPVR
ncbi:hypothetical protein XCR_3747 [Xanthomonas campestris pv. raphani 756C]|nr:hypothetical protein XCR_3747 [Xanthomonas campestris pv. raphani 756C]